MSGAGAATSEPALSAALRRLAALPSLLVAVDFDGTLSPLVDEPLAARPLPGSIEALGELAALPGTLVAIVSGRALGTLTTLSGAAQPLLLIGSHGVETSYAEVGPVMDEEERSTYRALDTDLISLLEQHPGARIERKPHSLVLHTRGMPPADEAAALRAGHAVAAGHPALVVTPGKGVLELATQHVGKGSALRELAAAHGVDATIYLGDDVTDEHAFEVLGPHDVSVKVGEGATLAQHRLHDESQVLVLLRELLELRRAAGADRAVSDDRARHRSNDAG
ncbi:trehalose-phosphatase [Ornithinimicrobium cryptoxanthini]|uniref:Trehalose 6-phosphate phosphatase n=1 Tax=Ornithinimicrobium cryptoxanthini TaxID=2934161 RepID=A0ABY4YJA5_9MICO|nr:trehalose-phosphatase [Ornithinimicrobium cryptoxanthini]USQ76885.1 trehalose-phosphatase [Ornithinimicrobium cryptoxanthini]